jgi:hypothetical protein
MRWAEHVTRMVNTSNAYAYNILVGNVKGKTHLKDIGPDCRIDIKKAHFFRWPTICFSTRTQFHGFTFLFYDQFNVILQSAFESQNKPIPLGLGPMLCSDMQTSLFLKIFSFFLYGSTALWTLAAFSVSQSYTHSVGLLGRGLVRCKVAICTQNNTNTE